MLFNDTIENNLAYGQLKHRSRAELLQAAEAAHVLDFVKEMPEGLETIVGDRGVLLVRRTAATDRHRPSAVEECARAYSR